jgi:2'-5' RNA ligase
VNAEWNLHVELPDSWASRARELAARLAPLGNAIDLGVSVPHATLYLATFPEDAREEIVAATAELARASHPFESEVRGLVFAGRGYVFLELARAGELERLHGLALERVSPLRRGLVTEDVRELAAKLSPREGELAEEHGFPWVSELYAPHVTIAKLPEGREGEARELLRGSIVAGRIRFESIALGETGPHGTVLRTMVRRRLGS